MIDIRDQKLGEKLSQMFSPPATFTSNHDERAADLVIVVGVTEFLNNEVVIRRAGENSAGLKCHIDNLKSTVRSLSCETDTERFLF